MPALIPASVPSEPAPQPRVTIISVCYQSTAVLPNMLASLPSDTPIVLVDNGSDDFSALDALAESHNATLICNDRNLGFGVACNQGAAMAETEFLLFLNPDTSLGPTTLSEVLDAAARYPMASAMNPRITNAKGRPFFKWRSVLMPRSEFMPKGWPPSDREVSVADGCALFVRRAAFEAVGGFDPAIFLYSEDDDLSRRLRAEWGPLMFIHAAVVTHLRGGSSSNRREVAALKGWHSGRSQVYAMRKHRFPLAFLHSLWDSIRKLVSVPMLYSPNWRAMKWGYFRGVISTLRDGGASPLSARQSVVSIRHYRRAVSPIAPSPDPCPVD